MTIVVDPSTTKGQGARQPSPPPSQPPPSYTESAATQPLVVQPGTSSVIVPALDGHAGYGPTPISQQQLEAALPYYDPRSVHSIQAAQRRARERFVGAVLWVLLILALLPVLVWMDMRIRSGWSASYCALQLLQVEPYQPLVFPLDSTHFSTSVILYYWLYRDVYTLIAKLHLLNRGLRFIVQC